jgi:hypothetical protein
MVAYDASIYLLRQNYGLATGRSAYPDDVTVMKEAIRLSYVSKLSTFEEPQHGLYPKDAGN